MRGRRTGGGRFRGRGGSIFREINKKKYSLQFKLIDQTMNQMHILTGRQEIATTSLIHEIQQSMSLWTNNWIAIGSNLGLDKYNNKQQINITNLLYIK